MIRPFCIRNSKRFCLPTLSDHSICTQPYSHGDSALLRKKDIQTSIIFLKADKKQKERPQLYVVVFLVEISGIEPLTS